MSEELFGTSKLFENVDDIKKFIGWARSKGAMSISVGYISVDFHHPYVAEAEGDIDDPTTT